MAPSVAALRAIRCCGCWSEGNTGNGKVEKRTRPTSSVVGYGYPDYAS